MFRSNDLSGKISTVTSLLLSSYSAILTLKAFGKKTQWQQSLYTTTMFKNIQVIITRGGKAGVEGEEERKGTHLSMD